MGTDGTVWRRGQDGDWKRALLLLPASIVQGVPRITSVTAFTTPLSGAILIPAPMDMRCSSVPDGGS